MRTQQLNTAPAIDAAYEMGATGGPIVEAERLAFEAWMRGHCWALCAEWDGTSYRGSAENGNYLCPRAMNTRQLWAAWRDRAALAAPQPAQHNAIRLAQIVEDGGFLDVEAEVASALRQFAALAAPQPEKPLQWLGLVEGERDKIVSDLIELGTGFVAPLYSIVEGIERVLMERNAAPQTAQYEQSNPLGGPAKVFDAMAAAIRAGDDYHAVLRQFGFVEAQPAQEPLFWYRPCSNGMYEGPIHNAQIERVRKESGAWAPLYAAPQHQPAQEPVGYISKTGHGTYFRETLTDELKSLEWADKKMWKAVFYAAPQPQRQPLFTELIAQHPGLAEELAAPQPAQEPIGFMSPKQIPIIKDPDDGPGGHYIPIRKTPAGLFTLALYTAPHLQRQPLADEYVQQLIAEASALDGAEDMTPEQCFEWLVRRVEKAHGITEGGAA